MSHLAARPLTGIPEISAGTDLAVVVLDAVARSGEPLADGDVLVLASKVVSKAEGRLVAATDREQAITAEAVREVARRSHPGGITRIVETRHGFVMAAAGVDASNVPPGYVLLLPVDPDASARDLATRIRDASGARIGVVITDTFGRPWREAQTDLAIGAAGVRVVADYRGAMDRFGRVMQVSAAAVVDELASAADLVRGKESGEPAVVISGLAVVTDRLDVGVSTLLRDPERDMFRLGTAEAYRAGFEAGRRASSSEGTGSA